MRRGYGELIFDLAELGRNDRHDTFTRPKNLKVFLDLTGQFFKFVGHFLDADLGQALQPQIEDGTGLGFREVIGAVLVHLVGRIVDQADVARDLRRRPAPLHQFQASLGRVGTGADGGDHLVNIGNGDG